MYDTNFENISIFNSWIYNFYMSLIQLFKKKKHQNHDIIGYWINGAGYKSKRTWNLSSGLQIVQKITENYCLCLYLSIGQVWWINELWFHRSIQKRIVLCTIAHHDVTDLVNQGMVKNTNIKIFLRTGHKVK